MLVCTIAMLLFSISDVLFCIIFLLIVGIIWRMSWRGSRRLLGGCFSFGGSIMELGRKKILGNMGNRGKKMRRE